MFVSVVVHNIKESVPVPVSVSVSVAESVSVVSVTVGVVVAGGAEERKVLHERVSHKRTSKSSM
jgi:hypothetical protein